VTPSAFTSIIQNTEISDLCINNVILHKDFLYIEAIKGVLPFVQCDVMCGIILWKLMYKYILVSVVGSN